MNTSKRSIPIIFIMVLPLFLLSIPSALAAVVNVAVDESAVTQDQAVQVTVSLDAQGGDANLVQAEILFPSNRFTLEKITDGSSAISLWIDPPKESSPGVIDLAGVMPGGFTGKDGVLFSFVLRPLATGTGMIRVASATVLANDGLGSPLPVTLATGTVINVSASVASGTTAQSSPSPLSADTGAPNPFTPQISSDPNTFGGKYFLVFSASDSKSGIDHYEVFEAPFSSWKVATSPYVLTDQSLSSDIYVRAVDHSGNFIVVKVPARYPHTELSYGKWAILAGIVLVVLMLLLFIWRARNRKH